MQQRQRGSSYRRSYHSPPRRVGRRYQWTPTNSPSRNAGLEVRWYDTTRKVNARVFLKRSEIIIGGVLIVAVILSLVLRSSSSLNQAGLLCLFRQVVKGL